MTFLYHYLFTYWVNRVAGRQVLGMAPAFRDPAEVLHDQTLGEP